MSPPHHLRRKARATAGSAEKMDTGMARSVVDCPSGLRVVSACWHCQENRHWNGGRPFRPACGKRVVSKT
eukprot:1159279-Pelagomonas_calceolata.AAC.15